MTIIATTRTAGPAITYTTSTSGRIVTPTAILSNDEEFTRDTPIRIPLDYEDTLRGLLMTREIEENPEEIAELERARAQAERGEGRWLDEGQDETEGAASE